MFGLFTTDTPVDWDSQPSERQKKRENWKREELA